ncbi:MAG: methyltransferase domain-containing protein [Gammaproteobacteria bacterium]|nr:methyltransferase domain-containing protein [Gammaproteobacteria bacterium]
MLQIPNEEINRLANANYSNDFIDMLRKWYDPEIHKNRDTNRLIIENIRPDNVHGVMYNYIMKHINVEGRSVLEVGCGSGQNVEAWHRAGAGKITTLDIDEFPVVLTKQRCVDLGIDNVDVMQSDFLEQEFDEKFDIINCVQVIEHVGRENQVPALAKLMSLAKKGGIVFIQLPNKSCIIDAHDSGLPFAHWLPRRIGVSYAKLFGRTPPMWDPMPYGKVRKVLEANGGEILNNIDLCSSLGEFIDYRVNKRRSLKNIIFAGIVTCLYPVLRGNTNAILPNINVIVRKLI